jgi:hypothetical protein
LRSTRSTIRTRDSEAVDDGGAEFGALGVVARSTDTSIVFPFRDPERTANSVREPTGRTRSAARSERSVGITGPAEKLGDAITSCVPLMTVDCVQPLSANATASAPTPAHADVT